MNILLITRFKLNTCEPYIIKYPIPAFDVRNSPVITPLLPPVRENKTKGYKIPINVVEIWEQE